MFIFLDFYIKLLSLASTLIFRGMVSTNSHLQSSPIILRQGLICTPLVVTLLLSDKVLSILVLVLCHVAWLLLCRSTILVALFGILLPVFGTSFPALLGYV